MKILYLGGVKSGKSSLAEEEILNISDKKPYYIATYDDSYNDHEMKNRIEIHKLRREGAFITIQEPINLDKVIKSGESYLVDCLSMWIMNLILKDIDYEPILQKILNVQSNIVFVLNDVGGGIIPKNELARKFVDISGIIGQIVAKHCDKVYLVRVGLKQCLK